MRAPHADVVLHGPTEDHIGAIKLSAGFLVTLIALVAIKLALVAWVLPMVGDSVSDYAIGHTPDGYVLLASNLANGQGYRIFDDTNVTMFREPGYVFTLAALFAVFGDNVLIARIANVAFAVASVFFVFGFGRLAGIDDRAIKVAVVLLLLHPAMIFAESRLGVESFLSLLVVATLYTMLRAQSIRGLGAFALAGVVAAMTALTRSAVIPVFALWGLYLLFVAWRGSWLPAALRGLVVFGICFVTLFSIWPLRNYQLSGQPIVSATVAGDAWYFGMYLSRHRDTGGMEYHEVVHAASSAAAEELKRAGVPVQRAGFTQLHASVEDELRHQQVLTAAAFREYRAAPSLWARTIVRNVTAFWIQGRTQFATNLNSILFAGTFVLTLAGLVLAVRRAYRITLLPLFILGYQAIHLPILAQARYQVVLIPLLMLLCGIALAEAYRRIGFTNRSDQAVRKSTSS